MKKYVAEFIGTFILVFIGCGTAMTVGCDANNGCGYILTAFAFGLAIVAMAYSLGNISGGHVNPAVSLAVLINGGMDAKDFVGYVVAQCLGAFAGSGLLACIFGMGGLTDKTGGLGANAAPNIPFAIVVEIVLTCIFIMTILGVTSKKQSHGSFGGLVIGLTLVGIHIIGIGLTGTSVNPARSLAPAVLAAATGNAKPLSQLVAFIVGPFIGAALGAFIYKTLEADEKKK
ncbi:MAG: aquaporin [Lachnospiraceae bacterium]|nr:aquaporin [Lachnospiraceae bacterium]MBO6300030.1 aquaporin [Lachnospiraceae bacterium]MCR5127604.1 aquaporin [Lachnospiraceae bacterium]